MIKNISWNTGYYPIASGFKEICQDIVPLAAGASSLSDFIPVTRFAHLNGTVYSDVSGTLQLEFSNDGINVDYIRTLSISADDKTSSAWDQLQITPFVRFRYINGASHQTIFRFYAYGKGVS